MTDLKMCPNAKCTNPITTEAPVCRDCAIWAAAHPDRPRPEVFWIVSEGNEYGNDELGVEIDGVPFWYYKWPDASPGDVRTKYRRIHKREFGEVIRRPGA